MNIQDYKGVFVFAQQEDNKLTSVSLELVGKAKELAADLGTEVTAVVLGSDIGAMAEKLGRYGADNVILADAPELKIYMTEPYAHVLTQIIQDVYKRQEILFTLNSFVHSYPPSLVPSAATSAAHIFSNYILYTGNKKFASFPSCKRSYITNKL